MKKMLLLVSILSIILIGGKTTDFSTITIVNKSEMPIAIQLQSASTVCANSSDILRGQFYYLPVPNGDRDDPSVKTYSVLKDTYAMQLYYIETWDPVYGFKCQQPAPNKLSSQRDIRLTVLPCKYLPLHPGEPTIWKFLPRPIAAARGKYFHLRFIY